MGPARSFFAMNTCTVLMPRPCTSAMVPVPYRLHSQLASPRARAHRVKRGDACVRYAWTKTAGVSAFTGSYITAAGVALTFSPSLFGLLFDATTIPSGWIRVGGVLASLFGAYYLGAAHGEVTRRGLRSMYWATVYGRAWLFLAFCAIARWGDIVGPRWGLVALGVLNMMGATTMALQLLRKDLT